MVVEPFVPGRDDEMWDAFVHEVPVSTMLHTRRFLSYHGDRFRDLSLLIRDDKGRLLALFPAAVAKADDTSVVSHPGATYGGLLCSDRCRGEGVIYALRAVVAYYLENGFSRLIYKAVPYIYHRRPFQDDLYALFRMEAERIRCDLSACVDLVNQGKVATRRKRGYKNAEKHAVRIVEGVEHAAPLWTVLEDNLRRKHGASPVHTLDEILLLHERFPEEIRFITAQLEQKVVAGVVLFDSHKASHAQYIAASEDGYRVSALDKVFVHCIARAKEKGKRYFDFGISNEKGGKVLNEGLYRFKAEFGASGVVHEFYELDLGRIHGIE